MESRKLGIFVVFAGITTAASIITAEIILRRKERQGGRPNIDEVLAHMHALKSCLQRAHDGGYASDQNGEIIENDFEFRKITYYLED